MASASGSPQRNASYTSFDAVLNLVSKLSEYSFSTRGRSVWPLVNALLYSCALNVSGKIGGRRPCAHKRTKFSKPMDVSSDPLNFPRSSTMCESLTIMAHDDSQKHQPRSK
eukprot:scaffold217355_cov32-Tisochrysis_lutea.AAC.3